MSTEFLIWKTNLGKRKGESDTLGGFITEQAGRILRTGEFIVFEKVELKVDAATPRKLMRIKISLPEDFKRDE